MKFSIFVLPAVAILETVRAAAPSCTVSSISSCSKAIQSTKTRTASLTSFCSSVLGCTKSTTTISGERVTVTTSITIWETYTFQEIGTETTTTLTYSYTDTTYSEVGVVTVYPTWTVEKFVIATAGPKIRDVGDEVHPRDFLNRRAPTSICPPADETKACSCLIGGCGPPDTKDIRKTIIEKTTEYSYTYTEEFITYTNVEYDGRGTTEVISYTWTETSGVLSTHTTTIKCTPSATSSTSFFHLQATNAPDINGKYLWAGRQSPEILSFAMEGRFTDGIEAATAFSIDSDGRLITRHKNGTHFANIDAYGDFQLFHLMTRSEIQYRNYLYLRCSFLPPSGRFPGGFKELYCISDGFWHADIWNFCPLYVEYFNAGLILGTEFSETSPDCYNVVFLVKPICGWA